MPLATLTKWFPDKRGFITGVAAAGLGGLLGPLVISYILDTTESYTLAFYIIAAITLGSAVVAFVVRSPRRESPAGIPRAE